MAKLAQTRVDTVRREKLRAALDGGARTWAELRLLTKLNDDWLGLTIGELLDARRIWTQARGEVRYYGLELRAGLIPCYVPVGALTGGGQIAYAGGVGAVNR